MKCSSTKENHGKDLIYEVHNWSNLFNIPDLVFLIKKHTFQKIVSNAFVLSLSQFFEIILFIKIWSFEQRLISCFWRTRFPNMKYISIVNLKFLPEFCSWTIWCENVLSNWLRDRDIFESAKHCFGIMLLVAISFFRQDVNLLFQVMTQRHNRHMSIAVYISVLAVTDNITLVFGKLPFILSDLFVQIHRVPFTTSEKMQKKLLVASGCSL